MNEAERMAEKWMHYHEYDQIDPYVDKEVVIDFIQAVAERTLEEVLLTMCKSEHIGFTEIQYRVPRHSMSRSEMY